MTVRELASYLNCHYMRIYKSVRTGDHPAFRPGSNFAFANRLVSWWTDSEFKMEIPANT